MDFQLFFETHEYREDKDFEKYGRTVYLHETYREVRKNGTLQTVKSFLKRTEHR